MAYLLKCGSCCRRNNQGDGIIRGSNEPPVTYRRNDQDDDIIRGSNEPPVTDRRNDQDDGIIRGSKEPPVTDRRNDQDDDIIRGSHGPPVTYRRNDQDDDIIRGSHGPPVTYRRNDQDDDIIRGSKGPPVTDRRNDQDDDIIRGSKEPPVTYRRNDQDDDIIRGSHGPPVTYRRNDQGSDIVMLKPEYNNVLKDNRPILRKALRTRELWAYLQRYDVIDTSTENRIKLNAISEDMVDRLLEHIQCGPCWGFHAFLRSCSLTNQDHIVRLLGFSPEDYDTKVDDRAPRPWCKTQAQAGGSASKIPQKAVQSHRDVYNRTLMRGRLFDIPSLDLPYDMEWCYMQVVATSDELLRNPEDILPADILKPKPGKPKPKTVLLSGDPGMGKSSFIRFYGHRWSQMKAGESEWDLIVILNVSTLSLTEGLSPREHIKEAIRQSLKGRGDKEEIMRSIDDESFNILIIPDGMDECRSFRILDMLRELIASCYNGELSYTVLATCRTGLCPVQESLFDRRLKIDGFKSDEGVQYVQTFYEHIQKPDDNTVYDYIAKNQMDLKHILTNPLCTHILCVVTADGTLKLTRGQRLRLKDLLLAMEKSMKRRQMEKCMHSGTMQNKDHEDEIKCFYNMALWALLIDKRTFDEDDMGKFGINAQHPYLTFMSKKKKYNSDLQDVSYWQFNHEMFHEYFAASALEELPDEMCNVLLLTISSDEKFRNTQKILFSIMGGDIAQLPKLTDMIRVNLITHMEWDRTDAATKAITDDIKEKCRNCLNLEDILNMLKPGKKDKMDTEYVEVLLQRVRSFYEDQLEGLPPCSFDQSQESSPFPQVYECLHELPEEHQQLVFADSLGCALPSVEMHHGDRHIIYNTGDTRWVEIIERSEGILVESGYCLTDAAEAVRQYGQQHLETWLKDVETRQVDKIWLDTAVEFSGPECEYLMLRSWTHAELWGDRPLDQFLSTKLWLDLLFDMSNWQVSARQLQLVFHSSDYGTNQSIVALLQCLQLEHTQEILRRMLVQDERGCLRIKVRCGRINSESLLPWTDWYIKQDLLQVQLVDLTCDITGADPTSKQEQDKRVKDLELIEHNGCWLIDWILGRPSSELLTWKEKVIRTGNCTIITQVRTVKKE